MSLHLLFDFDFFSAWANILDSFEGSSHTNVSATVAFEKHITKTSLESMLINVLARIRHGVPLIACRTSRLPDFYYQFVYTVPKTLDEVLNWAEEILFVSEEPAGLEEKHESMQEERWWSAGSGRYALELHVCPSDSEGRVWIFQ